MNISNNTQKLNSIKNLVNKFYDTRTMRADQLEKKVSKILELPKGYSQELYYEQLELLSSQTSEKILSN